MTNTRFETNPNSDYYVAGGTMSLDARSYVLRQADEDLFESLKAGKFCYVLTSRQMGKSSLMVRAASRLKKEAGFEVVVLDLTKIGQNVTVEQWYDGIQLQIGERLRLKDKLDTFWRANERFSPLQRWIKAMREVVLENCKKPIVIFIDEVDVVHSLTFSTSEFFAGIRAFYNSRHEDPELDRLNFCLIGVTTAVDLIKEVRTTPLNVGGELIELGDFTEPDTTPLPDKLGRDAETNKQLLKRIFYWTGGHPYLTQRFCKEVAENGDIKSSKEIDKFCQEIFLSPGARDTEDNLVFVRDRMLRSDEDKMGLLLLYSQIHKGKRVPYDNLKPFVKTLLLSGVARPAPDGNLTIRNRIYRKVFDEKWIENNMPGAEVKKQRAIYRKRLLGATAVAVVMAFLAVFSVAKAKEADRERLKAEASAKVAESEKQKAEDYSKVADSERQKAEASATREKASAAEANRERLKAVASAARETASAAEANDARLKAVASAAEANDQRKKALTLAGERDHERGRALISAQVAESAKQKAEDYSKVADSYGRLVKRTDEDTVNSVDVIRAHEDELIGARFTAEGRSIVSVGKGGAPFLRDISAKPTTIPLKSEENNAATSIAFDPKTKSIAIGRKNGTIEIWNAEYSGPPRVLPHRDNVLVSAIAFNGDGTQFVSADANGALRVWTLSDCLGSTESKCKPIPLPPHAGSINKIAFNPNKDDHNEYFATASDDGTVKIWKRAHNDTKPTVFRSLKHSKNTVVTSVAFSPDGKQILATTGTRIESLKTDSEKSQKPEIVNGKTRVWHWRGLLGPKPQAEFRARSGLFSGPAWPVRGFPMKLFMPLTFEIPRVPPRDLKAVNDAVFIPVPGSSEYYIASVGDDQIVKIWKWKTKYLNKTELITELRGHTQPIRSIEVSIADKHVRILTAGDDRTVRLWDPCEQYNDAIEEKQKGFPERLRAFCAPFVKQKNQAATTNNRPQ